MVVLAEGVRREGGKRLAQLDFGPCEQRDFFRRGPFLGGELSFEPRPRRRQLGAHLGANQGDLADRLRAHHQPYAQRQQQPEEDAERDGGHRRSLGETGDDGNSNPSFHKAGDSHWGQSRVTVPGRNEPRTPSPDADRPSPDPRRDPTLRATPDAGGSRRRGAASAEGGASAVRGRRWSRFAGAPVSRRCRRRHHRHRRGRPRRGQQPAAPGDLRDA